MDEDLGEMREPPSFFEATRLQARERWDLLERDPELAGPWWQLFRQVQHTRHVLSELLQNADDAGATWASARLQGNSFEFEHDGKDFSEDDFRSLCRFAFSNKRRLLTIGFRGIGFRSVFSLGPTVEVHTPSLAVAFDSHRFTEPRWIDVNGAARHTTVRVVVEDTSKVTAIAGEIDRWSSSPLPLLFFRSIRQLRLLGRQLGVATSGDGPCAGSRRVRLTGAQGEYLVLRSPEQPFPEGCQAEIRAERGTEDITLPPCEVVLVVGAGADGRLHVVLPTEVRLPLPFAAHAPFIQDPARTGIKEPALSPTNRWLLGRIGRHLARSMLGWLGRRDFDDVAKAEAYQLLPEPSAQDKSLAGDATTHILDAFVGEIRNKPTVLGHTGALSPEVLPALPKVLLDAWPPDTARRVFVPEARVVLSPLVSRTTQTRLAKWGLVKLLQTTEVLERLADDAADGPPPPEPLARLLPVWGFLDRATRGKKWDAWWSKATVLPANEGGQMIRAESAIYPPRRPADCKDDEWSFLLEHVRIVDEAWVELAQGFAKTGTVAASESQGIDFHSSDQWDVRHAITRIGLSPSPRIDPLLRRAAKSVFGAGAAVNKSEAVRLVRLAARYDVSLHDIESVHWLCRDGQWRRGGDLVADHGPDFESLFPRGWSQSHVLAADYEQDLRGPELTSWRRWLTSAERANIPTFPRPSRTFYNFEGESKLHGECSRREGTAPTALRLQSRHFRMNDWNWSDAIWNHWRTLDAPWVGIARWIADAWSSAWDLTLEATVQQVGRDRHHHTDASELRSAWIAELRGLPCLPDGYGRPHIPSSLYRLTDETSALLDVEPFIHRAWIAAQTQPFIDALGVLTRPTSAKGIIDRLEALAGTSAPPLGHVRDLYRALDRLFGRLDEVQRGAVREAFRDGPLTLTNRGWQAATHCFRDNPFGIPGVATVHEAFDGLTSLWERLGLRREPSMDDALDWLAGLPREVVMDADAASRVREVLRRYPIACWQRACLWCDLTPRLTPTDILRWRSHSRDASVGLFRGIKEQTADFTFIEQGDVAAIEADLPPSFEASLRHKVTRHVPSSKGENRDDTHWSEVLGRTMSRLRADAGVDAAAAASDRATARRLARSSWVVCETLRVQVLLDGTPAGPERLAKVAWDNETIYVAGAVAELFPALLAEISRHFGTCEARNAVAACLARPERWIEAYAAAHLELEDEYREPGSSRDIPTESRLVAHGDGDIDGHLASPLNPNSNRQDFAPPSAAWSALGAEESSGEGDSPGEGVAAKEPEDDGAADPSAPRTKDTALQRQTARERVVRYFETCGFVSDLHGGGFRHADGRRLRSGEGLFPWEIQDGDTDLPVFVAARSLSSRSGLELPAEIWHRTEGLDALLLEPDGDSFRVHRFSSLRDAVSAGTVGVFPSAYRLRKQQADA